MKLRQTMGDATAPTLPGLVVPGVLFLWVVVWSATGADSYDQRLLAVAGCYALLTLGYQFIFGHAGALSLAQGAFFGLGAYGSALTALSFGWPIWLSLPAGVGLALAAAAIAALPVIRLQSHYLALATLGLSQVVLLVAVDWVSLTGGSNGLPGVPPVGLFGVGPAGEAGYTLFVWSWVAAGALFAGWLLRRRFGRALALVRRDEILAAAEGLHVARLRLGAFLLSAGFGGLAGALYVHGIGLVSTDTLQFSEMVTVLCMAVIGGRTRIGGALVGAILLVHLPEWFRFLEQWALLAYGIGLLAIVLLAPDGIAGLLDRAWRRLFPAHAPMSDGPTATPSPPPQTGRPAALEVSALTKSFGGVRALDRVDLAVAPGKLVGVIGPNGSGKTTLLNCIGGQYAPDGGQVTLDRRDVTGWPAWRRARAGLGRSFQHGGPADQMTVAARLTAALPDPAAASVASALISRLTLGAAAQRRILDLEADARGRVALAAALAHRPSLLLLDEPAAGLTSAEQAALAERIKAISAAGCTVVVADHNMAFLRQVADRLVCLDAGGVIADGLPEQVLADPAVETAYLGTRAGSQPASDRPTAADAAPTPAAPPRLTVQGCTLEVGGGQTAVAGVSLALAPGEIHALLGANGAGKSVLLRGIAGLTPATGRIALDGRDLTDLSSRRRARAGLGYVPEGRRLFPGLTVAETLAAACFADRATRARRETQVMDLFPQLTALRDRRAWQLSGGQQQMLAIGRALMAGPRVLLMDEPSLGLAPALVDTLFERLSALGAGGMTILIAEQNAAVLNIADTATVLRHGRVAHAGPAAAIAAGDTLREMYVE